jgi:hypothetical protein
MDTHALAWTVTLMIATGLLGALTKALGVWGKSPAAAAHPALAQIASVASDICTAALTWLGQNPAATPQMAATWAVQELKASAPNLITAVGSGASDAALGYMVNRKMLSAAQAAPLSDASQAVIRELAPSAQTARIAPPQLAGVVSAAVSVAPDIESIAAGLLSKFPGLASLMAPAPVVEPAPAAAVMAPA